jgi:hypothetical protein
LFIYPYSSSPPFLYFLSSPFFFLVDFLLPSLLILLLFHFLPDRFVEVTDWTSIRETLESNLGGETGYPEVPVGFLILSRKIPE